MGSTFPMLTNVPSLLERRYYLIQTTFKPRYGHCHQTFQWWRPRLKTKTKDSNHLVQLNVLTFSLSLLVPCGDTVPSQHRYKGQSHRQYNQNPDVARNNRLALSSTPVEQRSREDGLIFGTYEPFVVSFGNWGDRYAPRHTTWEGKPPLKAQWSASGCSPVWFRGQWCCLPWRFSCW